MQNMIVFHDLGRGQPPTADGNSVTLHSVDNRNSTYSNHNSSNQRDDGGRRSETLAEGTIPVGREGEGRLTRIKCYFHRLVACSGVVCITVT